MAARGRAWATTGSEDMGEPINRAVLADLVARSYRVGWADGGLLLDYFREHGESVLLVADATKTGGGWICAWKTAAGTIVRKDAIPWKAVRIVAMAALVEDDPWHDPLPPLVERPVLQLTSP
jgi:hypothetical protein